MGSQHFRAGVGALVERADGLVLAFERGDHPGQWQLPQGGLDASDESPRAAVWRELREETALGEDEVELVRDHGEWLAYEWPAEVQYETEYGRRLGQVQRWFLFRAREPGLTPVPDGRELTAFRWVEREWLIGNAADMRRSVYARVLRELT